jgi:hypothetical protein
MFDKTGILEFVKLELGIDDDSEDILLNRYIDKVKSDINIECNDNFIEVDDDGNEIDVFPDELNSVVEDLVLLKYRLRGTENKVSEKIGDYSYTSILDITKGDLPKSIRKKLNKYRKVRFK